MTSIRKLCVATALGAASVLAAGAQSASGAGFALTLTGPQSAVVGGPFALQASGTDPTDQGALYLEVDAIPASVTSTCPSGYLDGSQLATSTGGSLVAFDDRETLDASGNFSMQVGYTPNAARAMLFCAYTDDGATDTLATSSWQVSVQAQPPTPAPSTSKPVNTRRPSVTRSRNRLTCNRGSWSQHPVSFSIRWLINGKAKRGASATKLTVTHGLRGRSVQCSVAASNPAGTTIAVSARLKVR